MSEIPMVHPDRVCSAFSCEIECCMFFDTCVSHDYDTEAAERCARCQICEFNYWIPATVRTFLQLMAVV